MGTWPGLLLSSKSPASRKLVPTQVFLHFIALLERLHPVAVYPLSLNSYPAWSLSHCKCFLTLAAAFRLPEALLCKAAVVLDPPRSCKPAPLSLVRVEQQAVGLTHSFREPARGPMPAALLL